MHAPLTRRSTRPGEVPFAGAGVLFPSVLPHTLPHPAAAAFWRYATHQEWLSQHFVDSVAVRSPLPGPIVPSELSMAPVHSVLASWPGALVAPVQGRASGDSIVQIWDTVTGRVVE
jgi:hypothetical protein